MLDLTLPLGTKRHHYPVSLLGATRPGPYPHVILIHGPNPQGILTSMDNHGKTLSGIFDIENTPRVSEVWVNLYRSTDGSIYSTAAIKSREVADERASHDRVGRMKFTLKEGQWDE